MPPKTREAARLQAQRSVTVPTLAQRKAWAADARNWQRNPAVWVSPARRSGRPCVAGTRLATDTVAGDWWARCWTLDGFRRDFGLSRGQVAVACWYEATYGTRTWRTRWGKWARDVFARLWSGRWDRAPLPPRRPA